MRFRILSPQFLQKIPIRNNLDFAGFSRPLLETYADKTLETVLIGDSLKRAQVIGRDHRFGLRFDGGVVIDDKIHLESAGRTPETQPDRAFVITQGGELMHQKSFERPAELVRPFA